MLLRDRRDNWLGVLQAVMEEHFTLLASDRREIALRDSFPPLSVASPHIHIFIYVFSLTSLAPLTSFFFLELFLAYLIISCFSKKQNMLTASLGDVVGCFYQQASRGQIDCGGDCE